MRPHELHQSDADVQILDVRETWEWARGRIDGALHIPIGELTDRQDEIATDRTVVCVCRSGSRSAAVASALQRSGWQAENLDGGLIAWAAAKLPLIGENGRPAAVA